MTRVLAPTNVHREVRKSYELAFFLCRAEGCLPCGHSHAPARGADLGRVGGPRPRPSDCPTVVRIAAARRQLASSRVAGTRPVGCVMVDEHGDLTFPRLGRRSVVNVPIDSIRAGVQRQYAEFAATPASKSLRYIECV